MDLTPFAPVKFTGNFKENASEWLEKFELYCDATDTQGTKYTKCFRYFSLNTHLRGIED